LGNLDGRLVPNMADIVSEVHDPYGGCEDTCTHDVARGVLTDELLNEDGPYPDQHPLIGTGWLSARIAAAQNRQTDRAQI